MIEVNLLPGGQKGSRGGGFSLSGVFDSLKNLRGGGGSGGSSFDPYMAFAIAAIVIAGGYMGVQFLGARAETDELNVSLEAAVQDSISNAATIQSINSLQARGDSIQERVQIIQAIDADRYIWPHLLDEIAAAVPDFTWLREILYQSDDPLVVRVGGRAGSIFAITRFIRRLEGSPFLRAVNPETIQETPSEQNPDDLVFLFELTLVYEHPPIDQLETVPLFEDGSAQAQTAAQGN